VSLRIAVWSGSSPGPTIGSGEFAPSTLADDRAARREDVPAIAALVNEFARYMRDLGDTTEVRFGAEALERDGFGADPAFRGLVAEVSGEVVGFLLHHAARVSDEAMGRGQQACSADSRALWTHLTFGGYSEGCDTRGSDRAPILPRLPQPNPRSSTPA
jgi:hypothetical protein